MGKAIEIKWLTKIRKRFEQYPEYYNNVIRKMLGGVGLLFEEFLPPYPPANPDSSYPRTGKLGQSLGSSESGGKGSGQATLFEITQSNRYHELKFGTNLEYAKYVIGPPGTQAQQHEGRWWRLEDVPERAKDKLTALVNATGRELVRFLNGRGL